MSPHEISAILDRPTSQELLARDVLRLAYVAKGGSGRSGSRTESRGGDRTGCCLVIPTPPPWPLRG